MNGNMLLYVRDPASQMSPLKDPDIVGYKFRSQPSVVAKLLSRIVGHNYKCGRENRSQLKQPNKRK
jgi:hypothetical protein